MSAKPTVVWGVHAVLAAEVRPTELVCSTQATALQYAATRSGDPGVLGAAVTELTVDELGAHTCVALYVDGKKQQVPYVSDDRRVFAGGAHRSP